MNPVPRSKHTLWDSILVMLRAFIIIRCLKKKKKACLENRIGGENSVFGLSLVG